MGNKQYAMGNRQFANCPLPIVNGGRIVVKRAITSYFYTPPANQVFFIFWTEGRPYF
jgi:hypothetical protein